MMQKTLFENENVIEPLNPAFCIGAVSRSTLLFGDCLEIMKQIPDKSIDAIITDPPYGTTACKWDSVIPFDLMWEQLNRIIKPNGAIVLFGSEPFSSALRMSNIKNYKYDWIWDKKIPSGHLNVKIMPLKYHEIVSVFSYGKHLYNRQFTEKDKKNQRPNKYKCLDIRNKDRGEIINEKEVFGKHRVAYSNDNDDTLCNPKSIISFENSKKNRLHPTQKPTALMEYLVKTYTNEGDMVLDFTMGSGSTGVACKNTNRNFIGIEKDENYYNVALRRCS